MMIFSVEQLENNVRTRLLVLVGLVLAMAAAPMSAGLISEPVQIDYLYPTIGAIYQTLGTGTVTAGGLTFNSFGQYDYTVFDTQIVLSNITTHDILFLEAAFNGYVLTLTGVAPVTISGVTVNSATNVSGFDSSRISFDSTHVWLNMQSLSTNPNEAVVLDLSFADTSVPEPATAWLVGLSLVGAGFVRRYCR